MKEGISFFSKNHKFSKNYKGQVWIETVMYTLIAFVMIGLVLTFARPKIQELQDKAIIDQSITMLKEIELTILDMGGYSGNQRIFELGLKKGELTIDGVDNKIIFEMESAYMYSEPGTDIQDGSLIIHTETIGDLNIVTLTRDYSNSYNIKYNEADDLEILTSSSVPYKLFLSNEGDDGEGKTIIDIGVI
jgi:hypothetical protein